MTASTKKKEYKGPEIQNESLQIILLNNHNLYGCKLIQYMFTTSTCLFKKERFAYHLKAFTNYASVVLFSFLDIKICCENSEFIISVYTELILTGLFTNFATVIVIIF